ncbi:hypothetical protein [Bradyrhizobium sp. USDA 313]|uniref:hypothetical protein n=1 Tax=Bradyrhizobium sp. USDA 313 TaxID=3156307 RepID=UPI003514C6D0
MATDTATKQMADTTDQTGEFDAYSIAEFCRRHSISLQMFYKLKDQGLMPLTFRVGTRVLVSKEAAAAWRREREADALEETSGE